MFLVYNSDILTEAQFSLPANDRAFLYGDGLFETIRYENGRVWFWPDHFERLVAGMTALQLERPNGFSAEAVLETILQLLSANNQTNQPTRIKILVWRRAGGLYTPTTREANVLITVRSGYPFTIDEKLKLGFYDAVRLSSSLISAYKTINSLPYVLAGLYKQQNGFDDVILLDTMGHLAECGASNLFWFRGETLYTPALQTGCVNGIARRQLLRVFTDAQEGLFLPNALDNVDAAFAANVAGIQVLRGRLSEAHRAQLMHLFTAD